MSADGADLAAAMDRALRAHVAGGDEESLLLAYEVGRAAVREGVRLVELVELHGRCLSDLRAELGAAAGAAADAQGALVSRASAVLRECLSALEMAYQGFQEAHKTLVTKHEELRRADQARRDLIAFLVHDFKNPLAALVLDLDYVRTEAGLSVEACEALNDARVAADSILRMTVDVLDVSRGEEGELAIEKQPVELRALLDQVAASHQRVLTQQRLGVAIECEAPLQVAADPKLLHRVLENLLDNCCKYAPDGDTVTMTARVTAPGWLDLSVADHGPGVPAEQRERIFEKYVRLDTGASAARTSRGLGLPFCRLVVERHGGQIWVEDNAPKGAAFRVRLPLA